MDRQNEHSVAKPAASSTPSSKKRQSSAAQDTLSPKTLTSFPSFSSPQPSGPKRKRSSVGRKPSGKTQDGTHDGTSKNSETPRHGSVDVQPSIDQSVGGSTSTKQAALAAQKTSPSMSSRTWNGAAKLHKSLIASLTRSSGDEEATKDGVFEELDWNASDPLEQATDDQIQRVIDRNGGAILSSRQFSKDLAESNGRVAEERNRKLDLVDRNRSMRDENEHLKVQLEDMQRKYKSVQDLIKQSVRPEHPTQIQVVDGPNGHYILDATTGKLIDFSLLTQTPSPASNETSSSVHSVNGLEQPSRALKQDAVSSLKHLASRKKAANDGQKPILQEGRKPSSSIALPPADSLELRSPVAPDSLPPALRETAEPIQGAPVDRLGFFFTASRETRHQEALTFHAKGESSETSSINSFPLSEEDHNGSLKTNTSYDDNSSFNAEGSGSSSTDYLSYAPVGPALRFVSTPENGVRMFVDVSTPSTPTIEIVATSSDSFSQPAAALAHTSVSGTMIAPTKNSQSNSALDALLEKLNQTHDTQQARRMNEWNAFHAHLKSTIPKTPKRASSDYGMASVARLCSKGNVSGDTLKKFNNLVLSGVPVALRREVWMERTGASVLVEPGRFASLLANATLGDYIRHEISIDVERTMGNNIYFRKGVGKSKLQDILIAYAEFNPTIGYSQGLNIIAGNLLLMLPSAEDAFWLLVAMIDNVLPHEYYDQDGLISAAMLEADGKVLTSYVEDMLGNSLHKHFIVYGVDLTMFTPGWFISAFAACLSGEALYRIWDVVFGFCDGRYVFCFALALLKINRRGLLACESSEELMLYLGGRMTAAAVSLDVLVKEAVRIGGYVTAADLDKRRKKFTVA